MSEEAEQIEGLQVNCDLNGASNDTHHQKTVDDYSHHKSKKKKKEKERHEITESDDDRTKIDSNTTNPQIVDSASISGNIDNCGDPAASCTTEAVVVGNGHHIETEKPVIGVVKTRRGRHKHRAEDKLNKHEDKLNKHEDKLNKHEQVGENNECLNGASHMTTEHNASNPGQKNVGKWEQKLEKKKLEYREEKNNLKHKLQETKTKFEEEIKKYETDLSDKRHEYLTQLTDLQMDDQMQSMAQRMEELKELEDELDRRFKQCVDFELEIEQAEKYLDRRGEICKSREEQLKTLDEELDTLHQELELDQERLETSGLNVNKILASKRGERFNKLNANFQSQSEEEDYVLKANLRKTQGELKSTKQNLNSTTEKLNSLTDEFHLLKTDKQKNEQKIKHLETQLAVALGQLTQRNLTSGNRAQAKEQDRYKSVHKHITLNRLNEDGLLSINQQAQLRRKNSTDRSSSSDGGRVTRKVSRLTSGLEPSTSDGMGSSDGSGSVIGDQVVGSMVSESGSSRSTTCKVM